MPRRSSRFKSSTRTAFKAVGILLFAALVLGVFYMLTHLGPKRVENNASMTFPAPDSVDALMLADQIESQVRQIRRASDLGPLNAQDIVLLRDTIALEEKRLQAVRGFNAETNQRLNQLRVLLQDSEALPLHREITDLDNQAQLAERQGDLDKARMLYRQAGIFQRQLNDGFPLSQYRSVVRLTQYERKRDLLTARPVYEESRRHEALAMAAIQAQSWESAKENLNQAIALQHQINQRYRNMTYVDLGRLERLERELMSLESGGLHIEVQDLLDKAALKEKEGDYLQAAEMYQQAARGQFRLNTEFAQSRFASTERLEQIERSRQVAQSRRLAEDINLQADRLIQSLQERRVNEANDILGPLALRVERFQESFPRSNLLEPSLLLKLQFLRFAAADIEGIQEEVYRHTLPLPEDPRWFMYRREVSQRFYEQIMRNNPSRPRGDNLAANSMTFSEAEEFTRRLGWLLGRAVRLPTPEEYAAAVGSLRFVDLNEIAWSRDNSDGEVQPVATRQPNRFGFYDLLGNVAEWTAAVPGTSARVIRQYGGSVRDSTDKLADKPLVVAEPTARSRDVGFRFVIDMAPGE